MKFKDDELVDRELEIAYYLQHEISMDRIVANTGLNRKIVLGHVQNMLQKLNAESIATQVKIIQSSPSEAPQELQSHEWEVARSKIRQAGTLYFAIVQAPRRSEERRNLYLTGIALITGVASVLFICDCILKLFMSNCFLQDLQLLLGQ